MPSSPLQTILAVASIFCSLPLATLIRTYGKTSYTLIETVVDVIVSHSPQQQTNKLYMEAMGVLITLFSRMFRNVPPSLLSDDSQNDIDHAISAVSPYYSPYFFLDLLFICSGMPLINETPASKRKDVPHWSSVLVLSLLRRMCQNDVDKLDSALWFPRFHFTRSYASDVQSRSILLYPFQLFGLLLPSSCLPNIRSPSATRCQLLLNLLLCVNTTTQNPFELTLNRMALRFRGDSIVETSGIRICRARRRRRSATFRLRNSMS